MSINHIFLSELIAEQLMSKETTINANATSQEKTAVVQGKSTDKTAISY